MLTKEAAHNAYRIGAIKALQDAGMDRIAGAFEPSKKKKSLALGAAFGTAAVGLPLAMMGAAMGGDALERKFTPESTRKGLLPNLRKALNVSPGVRIRQRGSDMSSAGFYPASNVIQVPRGTSPSILAHELGHASGRSLLKPHPISVRLSTYSLLPSLVSNLWTDPGSTASNIAKYAPGVLAAPALYEEARASTRALRALYHVAGAKSLLRGIPSLLGAYGTYGALAAAPILGQKIMYNMLD